MSNYSVTTNFGAKDALVSGNPLKLILGAQLTTEFSNIATAIATKVDLAASGSSIVLNSATGGDQGAGTINVAGGLFVNGVSVVNPFTTLVKPADTTRSANTTLTVDPDLATASLAPGTYYFEVCLGMLDASGAASSKLQLNFTGTQVNPANGTWLTQDVNPGSNGYRTNGANVANIQMLAVAGTTDMLFTSFILVVTVSGSMQFLWAQNVSQASGLTVRKGSLMRYQKIA